ncbi:MAG TPA: hypothetical protein IAA00_15225, partial [Candidatus Blautia ornithocaccae]|nr:hypothetical protein [Candidatus Blautia ornithocaccae]
NFVMSFTKDLTLSIEFSEILTVFIGKILPYLIFSNCIYKDYVTVIGRKSQYEKGKNKTQRIW